MCQKDLLPNTQIVFDSHEADGEYSRITRPFAGRKFQPRNVIDWDGQHAEVHRYAHRTLCDHRRRDVAAEVVPQ